MVVFHSTKSTLYGILDVNTVGTRGGSAFRDRKVEKNHFFGGMIFLKIVTTLMGGERAIEVPSQNLKILDLLQENINQGDEG